MFWRQSTSPTAPSRCSMVARQASAVSFASPGRMIEKYGMARSDISCSTAWCVGPSSPRPIESCVQTKIVGGALSAARRIDGRM